MISDPDDVRAKRQEAASAPAGADGKAGERAGAVCCSGGGIRSAAFCLGALQALQQEGQLSEARSILAVSGGSYIAAARALAAGGLQKDSRASGDDHDGRAGEQPAYALGTPEERNLRNNTHYLAPGAAVVLVGALSLLAGVLMTFIMVFAPLYALTHAWGWLLRWQAVLGPGQQGLTASLQLWAWILPAAAAGLTLAVLVWWRLTLLPRGKDDGPMKAALAAWAALITLVLAVMTLAVPFTAAWLFTSGGAWGDVVHFFGFGKGISWTPAALAGLLAAVAAVAKACQAGLAKWQQAGLKGTGGLAGRALTWLRQRLLPWLGSAVVVLLVLVGAVLWTGDGAVAGFTVTQLVGVLAALGATLLIRLAADVNRMSLHDFYQWRLASAYAVKRATTAPSSAPERAAGRQRPGPGAGVSPDPGALLSELAGQKPELVICATANINAARETPPGQEGFSLTFDPAHVALHRGAGLEEVEPVRAATRDYENLVGKSTLSLFGISAISGAAFSPLMGAATRQAYRILFTVANLRLGVWLPHPRIVQDARAYLGGEAGGSDGGQPRADRQDKDWLVNHPVLLLLWYLAPHPVWRHHADVMKRDPRQDEAQAKEAQDRIRCYEDREVRLWAYVLQRREQGRGGLWYWALQPTLGLLWAEAAGHTHYRSTWMCATDGGHYDNLALVEALRRDAEHIVVLDASGDKAGTWFTLGGAMALAKADECVDIDLDPTTMIRPDDGDSRKLTKGEVFRPWAHGTFTRHSGASKPPLSGDISVYKLGWWRSAPWQVRAYAAGHPEFPGESTAEQLYDGAEFEAYRALGEAAILEAARTRAPAYRSAEADAALASVPRQVSHAPATAELP